VIQERSKKIVKIIYFKNVRCGIELPWRLLRCF